MIFLLIIFFFLVFLYIFLLFSTKSHRYDWYSEKDASIHKSKYTLLLEQEKKRLNRNEKLLHMLEEIDTKAAALATKTERLKMLKVNKKNNIKLMNK